MVKRRTRSKRRENLKLTNGIFKKYKKGKRIEKLHDFKKSFSTKEKSVE